MNERLLMIEGERVGGLLITVIDYNGIAEFQRMLRSCGAHREWVGDKI